MIKIQNLFTAFILFLVISVNGAFAAEWKKYNKDDFMASQKAGEKILVDVFATWCPTCKAQSVIMEDMIEMGELDSATLYKVDYDKEKAFLKEYRIPRQSTILTFQGKKETKRIIAETDPNRLTAAILKGLE